MASNDNLISNGDFENQSADWTGTDIEANQTEDAYLNNGNDNRVAEMDGTRGQTTVMEQSFEVTEPAVTELTFDSALRDSAMGQAGEDGFTVEIIDQNGNVIADMVHLPDDNVMQEYSMPVTFEEAGSYTLRFTEIGGDDSKGALVDNVSIYVCFMHGTEISCAGGDRPVETIKIGDKVRTLDHGLQTVRWIGSAKMAGSGINAPVLVRQDALGNRRDLYVSQQHRMLLSGWQAEILFGKPQVLASAVSLVNDKTIRLVERESVEYFHILFDNHEIIFAEGAASESFHPNQQSVSALDNASRDEVLRMFPGLEYGPIAKTTLTYGEGKLAASGAWGPRTL